MQIQLNLLYIYFKPWLALHVPPVGAVLQLLRAAARKAARDERTHRPDDDRSLGGATRPRWRSRPQPASQHVDGADEDDDAARQDATRRAPHPGERL